MSAGRIVSVKCADLKEHSQASLVPDMQPHEWEAFKEDVRINGVQEPILVCKTTVIDGRQRLKAQKELHVESIPVRYEELTPKEQLDRLIRTALHRRHLNDSQRAMLAARIKPAYEKAAKERSEANLKQNAPTEVENLPPRENKGKTRDLVGAAVGVSGKSVDAAEKVIEQATPAIVEMVNKGDLSVSAAAEVADLPKREQKKIAKEGPKAAKKAASEKRKAKVSGGTSFDVSELEPSEVKDGLGNEPPAELRDVFGKCEEFDEQRNALTQVKKWFNAIRTHAAGALIEKGYQRLVTDLNNLDAEIKFAKPHAVCPYCKNKMPKVANCEACKGAGWVSKEIYEGCPKEMKHAKATA